MAKKTKISDQAAAANAARGDLDTNRIEQISDPDLSGTQTTPLPPETAVSSDPLKQDLAEVRELARSLFSAVQEIKLQNARNETLRAAIQDVQAEVRAASQVVLAPPAMASPSHVDPRGVEHAGKCGPCECVSAGCCAFDIKVWQVRAAKPQIEPADIGDIPGPTINALECQIYVTVDDMGVLIPGLSSCLDLRADAIPGGPGPWVVQNRVIQRVYIPKGATITKKIKCEVLESDERATELPFFKAELGEADGMITLECCMAEIFAPMPIDVYLLHGGEGKGMVQVAVKADRVCC